MPPPPKKRRSGAQQRKARQNRANSEPSGDILVTSSDDRSEDPIVSPNIPQNDNSSNASDQQSSHGGSRWRRRRNRHKIVVLVLHDNFPTESLSQEQCRLLQTALTEQITPGEEGVGPRFGGSALRRGYLALTCLNVTTKNWVKNTVASLQPWEDTRLKTELEEDILTKVKLWLPKPYSGMQMEKIFQLLKTQNRGLKTDVWNIVTEKSNAQGTNVTLRIDEASLDTLRRLKMQACLGLDKVLFRFLDQ
ncbi:unnamed protein product [Acanthoscelides obtectus]|uniref:DUF4780 domain-containing protein n=1 Tax=Acanthoscelides obtectus TaxID=200917 RepID=A0A9P0KET3_ACAOB|nr:unnamed protein product [Acanthoscelides obtectus]CAK1642542.1 hypothetical protein AOBTE_LOCUS13108 [Acanthoscelides obtectus]